MRRDVLKLFRRMVFAVVSGVALAGILAALLLQNGSVGALDYEPEFDVEIDDNTAEANAAFTTITDIPAPNPNYSLLVTFVPPEWGVATSGDAPVGALAGELNATATLGLLNAPCQTPLSPGFDMLIATTDTSDTVTFEEQFMDSNGNGLRDGVDKYPDFVDDLYPTPAGRLWGYANVGGTDVSLNFLLYEPGASLPGYPSFAESRGYASVTVLNDPTAPLVPDLITDFCTPLLTENTAYGVSENWPGTPADESGYVLRTNPQYGGTYVASMFSRSQRDADGDGIENDLDTCPHVFETGVDHRTGAGDSDADGLTDACDPTPSGFNRNADGDSFPNRQDNCPLVTNEDQEDGDEDGIGDACDQDDWNDDGDTDDPGEPTGFADNVPDGESVDVWEEVDIEISGPAPPTPEATPTVTGSPTPTPEEGTPTPGVGTPTPEATPTPTVEAEFCSPVFPGTYNGLVRIDGQPAASGYEVTATIDGEQWGSAIVSGGRYAMDIPDHLPTSPPCFESGTITFELDGMACTPSPEWASGLHNVDLACAPAAPPATPTPTPPPATPTPTPPVTPTALPPSGTGGLAGPSQGLPLWAMALASLAGLMTMAGLGTLVAAKRR